MKRIAVVQDSKAGERRAQPVGRIGFVIERNAIDIRLGECRGHRPGVESHGLEIAEFLKLLVEKKIPTTPSQIDVVGRSSASGVFKKLDDVDSAEGAIVNAYRRRVFAAVPGDEGIFELAPDPFRVR